MLYTELPKDIREDLGMLAGCVAGAEYIRTMLNEARFVDIKLTPKDNSREIISSWAPGRNTEDYVVSYIIEAIKQ
jgi:hypothetical protein